MFYDCQLKFIYGDYETANLFPKIQAIALFGLRQQKSIHLKHKRSDKSYVGAPYGDTQINPQDTLILYGRKAALMELDLRKEGITGEQAHQQAIATQQKIVGEQQDRDRPFNQP